ncbi:MAG: hypothetical protein WC919_06115 [Candidatus Paceibacterota bacterium]|jgi:hypothetical protein
MPDEINKELAAFFSERLKTDEYLRKLVSTPSEIPNPFFDITNHIATTDHEFRQEYFGEFIDDSAEK